MDIRLTRWKLNKPITDGREREIFFITAEAAGMRISPACRYFPDKDRVFTNLVFNNIQLIIEDDSDSISGQSRKCMSYSKALKELRRKIKREAKSQ